MTDHAFKHILLLEPDIAIREVISYLLTDAGFRVTVADPSQPFDAGSFPATDLVLIDVRKTASAGYHYCRSLKATSNYNKVAVYLLSTAAEPAALARGCGADGFLAKPFDIADLLAGPP